MAKPIRALILAALALFVVIALMVLPSRLLRAPAPTGEQAQAVRELDSGCKVSQMPCTVALSPELRMEFAVGDGAITAMVPAPVRVDFEGATPEHVRLVVEGKSMYMGTHGSVLGQDGDEFTGELLVPLCPMDPRMVWRGTFEVEFAREIYRIGFDFQTHAAPDSGPNNSQGTN